MQILQPAEWKKPRGFSHGVVAEGPGRWVVLAMLLALHFALVSAITALWPMGLVPLFVLVTGASLGLSYLVIEPLIERRFNRIGHALAAAVRAPKAIATAS